MRNTVFNFYFAWIIRQDGRHPNKTKELVVPKTACTMSYCQRDIPRVKHASITSTTKKKKRRWNEEKEEEKTTNGRRKSESSQHRSETMASMKEKGLSGKVFDSENASSYHLECRSPFCRCTRWKQDVAPRDVSLNSVNREEIRFLSL